MNSVEELKRENETLKNEKRQLVETLRELVNEYSGVCPIFGHERNDIIRARTLLKQMEE